MINPDKALKILARRREQIIDWGYNLAHGGHPVNQRISADKPCFKERIRRIDRAIRFWKLGRWGDITTA